VKKISILLEEKDGGLNMKKRILVFSTAYLPFIGGAEVAIQQITERLLDLEFDMITARMDPSLLKFERIGRINVYRIGIGNRLLDKLLVPFIGALKTLQLQRDHPYDAFWCMMTTFAGGAAYIANILRSISRKPRIPLVLTLQEGDSEEHLTHRWAGLLNLSWKLALSRTDILTVISTYLGDRAKRLGYRGEPILIPNGVDTTLFSRSSGQVVLDQLKQTLHKKPEDIFLITTSRLNIKNAVGDVIQALPFLPENVKFLIVGTGELGQELQTLSKRLGVESRVIFVGPVEYKQIPLYLQISDIFIRPSLSEGQGISFLEAMAAGLPIIATPVGGIVDFLFDSDTNLEPPTGIFVKVKNPESIARAVKRLMQDESLKQTLVENARRLVEEKYEWDLIADEMKKQVFETVA
jgi:glycosyltransferase involved in cell wall biosynthesis